MSGYSFVSELAGLIKKQKRVQVCHQLLPLNTLIALMPSASFSSGLTHLFVRTAAAGQENKNKQNNSQNHLAHKKRNAFHLFFLFEITFTCAIAGAGGTKQNSGHLFIIAAAEIVVKPVKIFPSVQAIF